MTVLRVNPRAIAEDPALSDSYRDTVLNLLNAKTEPLFILRRGAYFVTANVGEKEETLKGTFVDLYDEHLAVVHDPVLKAGSVGLWYDTSRIDRTSPAFLIAASARAERILPAQRKFTFTLSGPSEMTAAVRVWTKRRPKMVTLDGNGAEVQYDEQTGSTYFEYSSEGKKVKVKITF